jgi:hypothetical protein
LHDALARQMLGHRPARRAPASSALARSAARCRSFSLGGILLEIGQFEIEPIEHRRTLRAWPALLVLELGDRELHLLAQERAGADLGFEIARPGLLPRLGCRRLGERRLPASTSAFSVAISSGSESAVIIAGDGITAPACAHPLPHARALNPQLAAATSVRMPPVDAFEQIAERRDVRIVAQPTSSGCVGCCSDAALR